MNTHILMPTFPQPGLERRWKKLAGQPNGDAGDPYTGYDRFNRVEQMLWQRSAGVPPVPMPLVHVQWGYNRASLKTWRKDLLAPASSGQDLHFGYDGLYQVAERQRGLLNTNTSAIGGIPSQQEDFSYDETGNWVSYRQANTGELDIDQSRVNNRSNQITQVDGSSAGVSYDRNGNMLELPTGEALTGPPRKLVWDAWDRLVEVRDAEDTPIASYQYDAQTRRTVETTGAGESTVARHFYYNDQWRSVEERLDASTEPERQQVWQPSDRYELLLRDRSTGNDGEVDERLYPMKDQLDPVALCDATGTVVERYAYSAFGMPTFLNADFTPVEGSASALFWNFLFHAEFSDPQTGWFNYGYRYYLPELGRWPSRDAVEKASSANLYAYVDNRPLGGIDLLGLSPAWALPPQLAGNDQFSQDYQKGWYDIAKWAPAAFLAIPVAFALESGAAAAASAATAGALRKCLRKGTKCVLLRDRRNQSLPGIDDDPLWRVHECLYRCNNRNIYKYFPGMCPGVLWLPPGI